MVTWEQCAADFASDGALRDVYVLDGGLDEWNALLDIARRVGGQFAVDGKATPLPGRAHDVFVTRESATALLSFNWGGIGFAAHFFVQDEVELDFVPKDVTGQERLDALCTLLRELATTTNKEVIVTPENYRQSPILRIGSSGSVRYERHTDAV
jgi:hypothetical protein